MRRLLAVLLLLAAALAVADVAAERLAESEVEARLAAEVPEASGVSARISSFPFLGRLLTSGRVAGVDARARGLQVEGLDLDLVAVHLEGVTLDRRLLWDDQRVAVLDIDRGRVRAEVTAVSYTHLTLPTTPYV